MQQYKLYSNGLKDFQTEREETYEINKGRFGQAAAKCLGIIIHIAHDACIFHHSKGYVLKGHSEYEGKILDNFSQIILKEPSSLIPVKRKWIDSKKEVERNAYFSSHASTDKKSMTECVLRSIDSTRFILENLLK